jgi:agmatinase
MHEEIKKMLCPPGAGVFTVNTAKEKKEALYEKLYQTSNTQDVEEVFKEQLEAVKILDANKVALLGVCSDAGGGILRGANWGPLYIREKIYETTISQALVELGDIRVNPHLLHDKYLNQETISVCQEAMYGQKNQLPVSPLSITESCLTSLYETVDNFRLYGLGGDHSVSYPLVKTYLNAKKAQRKKVALIHFDAHTDLLSSRLGIDICFGSWVTHILDGLEKPGYAIQLGIRSTGKSQSHWESTFGVQQIWAKDIKRNGIKSYTEKAIHYLGQEGVEEIYISFDIDALDESIAGATGTPEPDGLSLEEALESIALFTQAFSLTGADLCEVAPMINRGDANQPEKTLNAAQKISEAFILAMTLRQ